MRITLDTINKVYKASPCNIETMELLGYQLIDELFVDSSGFGSETEPALTRNGFEDKLKDLLKEHGQLTAKITGAGMFQVYIGLFKKTGHKVARRISTNVLEINTVENGVPVKKIRLYDTDILTFKPHSITFDNGGYATITTHKWMNKFLPQGFRAYRKDWITRIEHNDREYKVEEPLELAF